MGTYRIHLIYPIYHIYIYIYNIYIYIHIRTYTSFVSSYTQDIPRHTAARNSLVTGVRSNAMATWRLKPGDDPIIQRGETLLVTWVLL